VTGWLLVAWVASQSPEEPPVDPSTTADARAAKHAAARAAKNAEARARARRGAAWASAGALGVLGATGGAVTVTSVAAGGAVMLAVLPALFQANPLACACVLCALPAGTLGLLGAAGAASTAIAPPVAQAVAQARGGRRVPLLPLVAATALPMVLGLAGSAGVMLAGTVLNGACLCCSFVGCLSWMRDRHGWQGAQAEYFILRRVSPAVLYAGVALTGVAVFAAMVGAGAGAAALTGLVAVNHGRPSRDTDRRAPDLLGEDP
jgi:hypothetical protein